MSPSTGEAYSDAFSPELARSWSAASQSFFCSSLRSVAKYVLPRSHSILVSTVRPSQHDDQTFWCTDSNDKGCFAVMASPEFETSPGSEKYDPLVPNRG